MSAEISFQSVRFSWPESSTLALGDVTVDLDGGAFVLITGHSGSGKSTMLRTLNGLVPHSSGGRFGGRVVVDGHDTRTTSPRDLAATVGMVFQDPEAQMITGRVDDEIAFALEQRGVAPREIRQRLEDVLDLLGIEHLRHRRPTTLSGGEQQRLAIAAAMALQPRVLALDEPTSQLDPAAADGVLDVLTRLHDDLGITVIAAEHRLERLLHRVDRVLDLHTSPTLRDLGQPHLAANLLPIEALPPVTRLGRALGSVPIPLTVIEARRANLPERVRGRLAPPGMSRMRQTSEHPVVALRGARVEFDGHRVLDGVDVHVHPSEVVALMGRNGSGKTTLLRSLAGFQALSAGTFDPLRPASFAWLPQQASTVFFKESVHDEVAWTLARRQSSFTVERVLDEFGLSSLADRHPRDLSGGERERAALATMLAGDPDLILLDEPTRGMDAGRKANLVAALQRRRDRGAAVVLATHDSELVGSVADRVVVLAHGDVIADGPPREILPGSLSLAPQLTRLLGAPWLTVDDALVALPAELPETAG